MLRTYTRIVCVFRIGRGHLSICGLFNYDDPGK